MRLAFSSLSALLCTKLSLESWCKNPRTKMLNMSVSARAAIASLVPTKNRENRMNLLTKS